MYSKITDGAHVCEAVSFRAATCCVRITCTMLRRAGAMTSQCLAGRVRALAGWSTSAPASSASRCWYARILSGCADDFSPCKKMHLRTQQAFSRVAKQDAHTTHEPEPAVRSHNMSVI